MKKWSGGTLILALALVLILRYGLRESPPQRKSTYVFFNDNSIAANFPTRDGVISDIRANQLPESLSHSNARPHLLLLEGVESLYDTTTGIPPDVSAVILLWASMGELISRSDSLPGTAQGVKEAAIAWKHLLRSIEEQKTAEATIANIGKRTDEDFKCPFSLTAFDISSLNNNGSSILEVPCGLVQDSSVTVVGIPGGNSATFVIDLLGSSFPGHTDPDIILRYNVTFKNDNEAGHPIIVQNTWTSQQGWGAEERCPSHGSSFSVKGMVASLLWSALC